MSLKFNSHGIQFKYLGKDVDEEKLRVNARMVQPMETFCSCVKSMGFTKIDFLGITENRKKHGSHKTSLHSEGLFPSFKSWEDGSHGSRAFDLIGIYNDVPSDEDGHLGANVHSAKDRMFLVRLLEICGMTVHHQALGSLPRLSDHVHGER